MVTPIKFTREIRFESQPEDTHRTYLVFIVRARDGAVSLRVALQKAVRHVGGVSETTHDGWTLNSHFKRKTSDWWLESDNCDVLEQGHCFGDTGYGVARDAWNAFQASEDEGWKYLEDTYNEWRKG